VAARRYISANIARLDKTKFDFQLGSSFRLGLSAGTIGGESGTRGGELLADHFVEGGGGYLFFRSGRPTSNEFRNDPRFIAFAKRFETAARTYFDTNGTIVGFDGNSIVDAHPHFGGITQNIYLATIMGGVQGAKAEIRMINSSDI